MIKKTFILLTASTLGLLASPMVHAAGSEAQWEQALNRAWHELSNSQRKALLQDERNWATWKDSLADEERYNAIRNRALYLESVKDGHPDDNGWNKDVTVAPDPDSSQQVEPSADQGMSVEASAQQITGMLERMGNPATLVTNSAFVQRNIAGYSYLVAKGVLNNWTMGMVNYGEVTMGIVWSLADNWVQFMTLADLRLFLATGNRSLLHLPNLKID